jgi:hypothetical protein
MTNNGFFSPIRGIERPIDETEDEGNLGCSGGEERLSYVSSFRDRIEDVHTPEHENDRVGFLSRPRI